MQQDKDPMYSLIQELLSCRGPSPSYQICLQEQLNLFKIKAIKEGRPCEMVKTPEFPQVFTQSDFIDQHFLCEIYLYKLSYIMDVVFNLAPCAWDIHLRAFTSFVNKQVRWWNISHTISKNEESATLGIRGEPMFPTIAISKHQGLISSPSRADQIVSIQKVVIESCIK